MGIARIVTLIAVTSNVAPATPTEIDTSAYIEAHADTFARASRAIWEWAEVGYQEERSTRLLQETLAEAGFKVEAGVAGMPTAFVAEYGEGGHVIALLAEFDALPGINQDDSPERREIEGKAAGHACGHHLFGTGSTAAAMAVREWLAGSGTPGRVRVYGTPAEEGGAGKVYMVRAGLFDDVDAVLTWHPSSANDASPSGSLANKSAKFRFKGISAHAAAAPERGRSALDGVESMNVMVNMMREHVPEKTRIHYVITRGGSAPNVIPDFAEVYYYVRHPEPTMVKSLFDRVVRAAEGAALGTGTGVSYEVIHGIYNKLPNDTLARRMDANLRRIGGVRYDTEELEFARALRKNLPDDAPPLESAAEIHAFEYRPGSGSTDVGDVSWTTPTTSLATATWVPGTTAHSWQAIAAGRTSIGVKGMLVAAKTLALTARDLLSNPELLQKARAEFDERRGDDFIYEPLLGDRPPPLDYRR